MLRRLGAGAAATAQELRELGIGGALFRVSWEARVRSGWAARAHPAPARPEGAGDPRWTARLPFADPKAVAAAVGAHLDDASRARLVDVAQQAAHGRVTCFGRAVADFGEPIEWHRNPASGELWPADVPWTRALRDAARVGDVKMTWEIGRFPHAFHMARAAAYAPAEAPTLARALGAQVRSFVAANPRGRGVHWYSGQEIAFRIVAWLFGARALLATVEEGSPFLADVADAIVDAAAHIERHIDYARRAVHNNHVLSEALGLLAVAASFPAHADAPRWRRLAIELFDEQSARQFYPDGGYLQQSHNYHRVALQDLCVAWALLSGTERPASMRRAMERSIDFLCAVQNPADGGLPNYGANDGALPLVLSTCEYADFRPTLQAVSLAVRGERLYPPGPWDEEAAWLLGPGVLAAPLAVQRPRSRSFQPSGHHVVRGDDPGTFATLRCGSVRDRFGQMDMLHVDVWWRGVNVLADGGSYLYNGPAAWHAHFMSASSHNTLTVDGRDQMLHHRRFKTLYWTRAATLAPITSGDGALVRGEHYGFSRGPDGCVHRRTLARLGDDLWVVIDRVLGEGSHRVRMHWLAGELPWDYDAAAARLSLTTPAGRFSVTTFDVDARPLAGDVVSGVDAPPRGWLSRYYGSKSAVASLVVAREVTLPWTAITLLGVGAPTLERRGAEYTAMGRRFSVDE